MVNAKLVDWILSDPEHTRKVIEAAFDAIQPLSQSHSPESAKAAAGFLFPALRTNPQGLRSCGDCAVLPGEHHQPGCDVERCKQCGWQAIGCDCDGGEVIDGKDKKSTVWTGIWPGKVECEEYEIFNSEESQRRMGWGKHDLNTLAVMCATGKLKWDRDAEQWVKK